jgi:hypothetical protein
MAHDELTCDHCPGDFKALEVIETRFERGLCFMELQCRHCLQFWTGEVSVPDCASQTVDYGSKRADQPRWRLITLTPQLNSDAHLAVQ